MRKALIAFLGLAQLSGTAPAADKDGRYAIKGVGNSSCEQYLVETGKQTHNAFVFAGFLNGYITAQNQHLKDTFDLSSWENIDTLASYLAGYCEKHRDKSFFTATASLVNALFPQRIQAASPVMEIGEPGKTVQLYDEVVKRTRTKLADADLLQASGDAKFDAAMRDAIRAFQKKHGLDPTGMPDQQTLHRLFRGEAPSDKPK
jgi:murein L,D-transpeptidase YcbB/YkuD